MNNKNKIVIDVCYVTLYYWCIEMNGVYTTVSNSDVILTQAEEAEYTVIVNDNKIRAEMVVNRLRLGSVATVRMMADKYNVSPKVFAVLLYDLTDGRM